MILLDGKKHCFRCGEPDHLAADCGGSGENTDEDEPERDGNDEEEDAEKKSEHENGAGEPKKKPEKPETGEDGVKMRKEQAKNRLEVKKELEAGKRVGTRSSNSKK